MEITLVNRTIRVPRENQNKINVVYNINLLQGKKIFNFDEYNLIMGVFEDKIIFHCSKDSNDYQTSRDYDTITREIPIFQAGQNIKLIYSVLVRLFTSNNFQIISDNQNQIEIKINLKDIVGKNEFYSLNLFRLILTDKNEIKFMKERIFNLEKKVEELTKENIDIKEKMNLLYNLINQNIISKKGNNNIIINPDIISYNGIKINTKIISNNDEINFILKEVEKNIGQIKKINLIYRASRDTDSLDVFHSYCDNVPNTFIIIKTSDNYKFGGFTSSGWTNENGNIYDEKAFCFSINLRKIYNIVNPKHAMHIQSNDGRPSFGSLKYVFLLQKDFSKGPFNYVEEMIDYEGESSKFEINGEKRNFKANELEVFKVL